MTQVDFEGDKDQLQELISALIHDGWTDALKQFHSNKLYGGDIHANWYEVIPLVLAAIRISCRRFLLDRDVANLDDAIEGCIYNTSDQTGYHHVFGNSEYQRNLTEISDLDEFSNYVDQMYRSYLSMSDGGSPDGLVNCEIELGRRMSVVEGDRARTGLVMRRVLEGTKRVFLRS